MNSSGKSGILRIPTQQHFQEETSPKDLPWPDTMAMATDSKLGLTLSAQTRWQLRYHSSNNGKLMEYSRRLSALWSRGSEAVLLFQHSSKTVLSSLNRWVCPVSSEDNSHVSGLLQVGDAPKNKSHSNVRHQAFRNKVMQISHAGLLLWAEFQYFLPLTKRSAYSLVSGSHSSVAPEYSANNWESKISLRDGLIIG